MAGHGSSVRRGGRGGITKKKTIPITRVLAINMSKGLNKLVSPTQIDNLAISDGLNNEFDEGGVIRKRAGFVAVGNALSAAKGLGNFTTESFRRVCTVQGTSLAYLNGTSWSNVAGAAFTTGLEVVFTQVRNKLYVWNGGDGGASWDGTTNVSRPGTMPKAAFAIFYTPYHVASGVPGQPNRVYISQPDDASAFTRAATVLNNATEVPGATVFTGTTANFIDVAKDDGDFITGLAKFGTYLLIFKQHSIYQLDFDASGNPEVSMITGATGCVSHKSIEAVENDVYFLSPEGVRVLGNQPQYFTAIRTNIVSTAVQPIIDSINKAAYTKVNGLYVNNEYILAAPTASTTISTCIVFDKRFGGFLQWDTIIPNAMVLFVDSQNKPHFYWLSDTGTQMYEVIQGRYNDNGAAINSYFTSKAQDFGNLDITKLFVDLGLLFRRLSGLITINLYTDDGISAGSAVLGSGSVLGLGVDPLGTVMFGMGGSTSSGGTSGGTSDIPLRIVANVNSRTLQFKVSNNRVDENYVFLGCIYGFYPSSHFNFPSSNKIYL
jgi:hypothetical protein